MKFENSLFNDDLHGRFYKPGHRLIELVDIN